MPIAVSAIRRFCHAHRPGSTAYAASISTRTATTRPRVAAARPVSRRDRQFCPALRIQPRHQLGFAYRQPLRRHRFRYSISTCRHRRFAFPLHPFRYSASPRRFTGCITQPARHNIHAFRVIYQAIPIVKRLASRTTPTGFHYFTPHRSFTASRRSTPHRRFTSCSLIRLSAAALPLLRHRPARLWLRPSGLFHLSPGPPQATPRQALRLLFVRLGH